MSQTTCPSCNDAANAHYVLQCLHELCQTCFDDMQREYNGICPYCGEPSTEELFVASTQIKPNVDNLKNSLIRYNSVSNNLKDILKDVEFNKTCIRVQIKHLKGVIDHAAKLTDLKYIPPSIVVDLKAKEKISELFLGDCDTIIEKCNRMIDIMLIAIVEGKYDIMFISQLENIHNEYKKINESTKYNWDFHNIDGKWEIVPEHLKKSIYKVVYGYISLDEPTLSCNNYTYPICYSDDMIDPNRESFTNYVIDAEYDPFTNDIIYVRECDKGVVLYSAKLNKKLIYLDVLNYS